MNIFIEIIVKTIPRNIFSYLVGRLAQLQLPSPFNYYLNRLFVYFYKINIAEAEHALSKYKNIQDFFTRRLKSGLRPAAGDICSPADGTMLISDSVDKLRFPLLIKKKQIHSL